MRKPKQPKTTHYDILMICTIEAAQLMYENGIALICHAGRTCTLEQE